MKIHLTLILITLLASSCDREHSEETKYEAVSLQLATPDVFESERVGAGANNMLSDANSKVVSDTFKKIIKTGELSFETSDIQSTRKHILSSIKLLGGYVAEETESGYENERKNYTLNLRVPEKNFDMLLEAISSKADRIDNKNIQIQDVTSEFIDTKTRLHNKKLLEKRYLELLSKASKITDMLSIENKISDIRSEIESIEGQFLHLQKQVAYSSLKIEFYTRSIVQETNKGFWYQLQNSLSRGLNTIKVAFFELVAFWPLLIIVGIALIWFRVRRRKMQALK